MQRAKFGALLLEFVPSNRSGNILLEPVRKKNAEEELFQVLVQSSVPLVEGENELSFTPPAALIYFSN